MKELAILAEPGKQEVFIVYEFEYPRPQVFDVFTNPSLISQWWGPNQYITDVDKFELKPGGLWRFVQHDADGNEFAFHGVYHDIERPERIVYTFEFEGMPGHVLLETVRFEALQNKTRIIDQIVFQSIEDRDGMLDAGMIEGSKQSMQRISKLLGKQLSLSGEDG